MLYHFCRPLEVCVHNSAELVGYHLSGLFCDFREAFEHTHEVRPKKPRDFFGVLLVTLIFPMQVLLQDY